MLATVNTPSDKQVEVVRGFDAPINLVWKTFTDADSVRQWMMGPPGWSMPVCEMDFQIGGKYENVFRNEEDGSEIVIVGDFREIEMLRKIVQDEIHRIGNSGSDAEHKTVVTFTFEQSDVGTTISTLIEYTSKEARDEALATGMGPAMEMGYRRIDEILAA